MYYEFSLALQVKYTHTYIKQTAHHNETKTYTSIKELRYCLIWKAARFLKEHQGTKSDSAYIRTTKPIYVTAYYLLS